MRRRVPKCMAAFFVLPGKQLNFRIFIDTSGQITNLTVYRDRQYFFRQFRTDRSAISNPVTPASNSLTFPSGNLIFIISFSFCGVPHFIFYPTPLSRLVMFISISIFASCKDNKYNTKLKGKRQKVKSVFITFHLLQLSPYIIDLQAVSLLLIIQFIEQNSQIHIYCGILHHNM